jgi:hypothetical protein
MQVPKCFWNDSNSQPCLHRPNRSLELIRFCSDLGRKSARQANCADGIIQAAGSIIGDHNKQFVLQVSRMNDWLFFEPMTLGQRHHQGLFPEFFDGSMEKA